MARVCLLGGLRRSLARQAPLAAAAARAQRSRGLAALAAVATARRVGRGAAVEAAWADPSSGSPRWHLLGAAAGAAAAAAAAASSGAARCDAAPAPSRPEIVESLPEGTCVHKPGANVRLYQFESCPFCRKVRTCLDYSRIPYEIVEVNPLTKAETKPIAPDYSKVPILTLVAGNDREVQLRDSKTIVRSLLGSRNPGVAPSVPAPRPTTSTGKMWPPKEGGGTVEEQWVLWTDRVLVQCIVLNVYRTVGEAAETFQYLLTHPSFPWYAQRSAAWSGTAVMWGVAQSRKRKYEISDVRMALFEALEEFAAAVRAGGGRFLGGDRPGAVDFNVFGILRSAESCQTERDMLEKCQAILPWYQAMVAEVGPSSATSPGAVQHRGG